MQLPKVYETPTYLGIEFSNHHNHFKILVFSGTILFSDPIQTYRGERNRKDLNQVKDIIY